MKFSELKEGHIYERESDKLLFKKRGEKYYSAKEGENFKETDEVSLSDSFSITSKLANDSLMDIYNTWKNGNIEEKQRAFDRLLLGMINKLENKSE